MQGVPRWCGYLRFPVLSRALVVAQVLSIEGGSGVELEANTHEKIEKKSKVRIVNHNLIAEQPVPRRIFIWREFEKLTLRTLIGLKKKKSASIVDDYLSLA